MFESEYEFCIRANAEVLILIFFIRYNFSLCDGELIHVQLPNVLRVLNLYSCITQMFVHNVTFHLQSIKYSRTSKKELYCRLLALPPPPLMLQ